MPLRPLPKRTVLLAEVEVQALVWEPEFAPATVIAKVVLALAAVAVAAAKPDGWGAPHVKARLGLLAGRRMVFDMEISSLCISSALG